MKRTTRRILKQERARRAAPRAAWNWRASPWPWAAAGALLLVLALLVSWRIEQAAARYQQALRGVAGSGARVVDLGRAALPARQLQGDWVRVVGTPRVIEAPRDPDFNQSADALLLRRDVAMFQWQQVDVGYPVYELEWQDGRVDSAAFARPDGHANPTLPVQPMLYPAPRVRLDGFILDPALVERIPGHVAHPVDAAALPPNLAATFSAYAGELYSGDPRRPRLGDVRLRWSTVAPQQVTVLARVDAGRLVAAPGAGVQLGDRSLGDLLPQLPPRPLAIWPTRLVTLLLAVLGVALLLRARASRVDPLLALLGGIAMVLIAPVPAWMAYSIGLGIGLAALLLAVLVLFGWRWHWHWRARRGAVDRAAA